MEISGQLAIVTGGTSGIGKAVAEHLRGCGARVVVWDIDPAADVVCDMHDPESIQNAIDATTPEGVPTILVAAAGGNFGRGGTLLEQRAEDWDFVFDLNARGVMLCYQAVARMLVEAQAEGSLVGISSINANLADPGLMSYSSAKAALNQVTRTAAVELGPYGIRVNAISPGPTRTPSLEVILSDQYTQLIEEATPLHRVGTAEDIARATVSVIEADWITGQIISVDGGASLVSARGLKRGVNIYQRRHAPGDDVTTG